MAGHEGYITVGLYPDGRPGELFITMAKEGSTIGGLMDCFGTAVSMSLQYGVPLEVYVNKFSHTRFEPMGHTKNPDIRIAKSIVDYIFRWLGITFLPGYREANAGPCGRRETRPTAARRTPTKQRPSPPPRRPAGRKPGKDRPPTSRRPKPPRRTATNGSQRPQPTKPRPASLLERAGVMKVDLNGGNLLEPDRAVRQLPDRCSQLRQLRRDHGPQRQLLPVPQLRQQHGLLVKDCRAGCPRATR